MVRKTHSGVSPVIGIILMVAVTVALVALAATVVFDLGTNVQQPADVSVDLRFDDQGTNNGVVRAEIIRNNNAESVELRVQDDSGTAVGNDTLVSSVGSTGVGSVSTSGGSGTATVVAIVEGSNKEQIIDSLQYEDT